MPKKCGLLFAVVLCALAAWVPATARAGLATIYDLGTLSPSETSSGQAINASGQVAGVDTAGSSNSAVNRAFLYSGTPGSGGAMADLGNFGGSDGLGHLQAYGYGINATGQVAGYSIVAGGEPHAFRYSGTPGSGGVMTDLGTLSGNNPYSKGYAINAGGQVVGTAGTPTGYHAFLYTGTPGSGGAMVDLGTLGGATLSQAWAINASGQVVGDGGNGDAFLYMGTPGNGGAMTDLGNLGGGASRGGTSARAINASGQVAGFGVIANGLTTHAFLYSGTPGNGGAMVDLGDLGGGFSEGFGLNDNGQVVGTSKSTSDPRNYAFLYVGTPGVDGHMINLNSWLDANNPVQGAQWQLNFAYGINDSGLITGVGTVLSDGVFAGTHAFVLDASALVPEPGSLALLSLCGLAVLRRRPRRQV